MNPIPTPALALKRSGNLGSNTAVDNPDMRLVLTLNHHVGTIMTEIRKTDGDFKAQRTSFAKTDAVEKKPAARSLKSFAVRPPERWGINE